ncbi:MAG: hypothetical protein WBE04_12930 [Methyloceanibacter sp.]
MQEALEDPEIRDEAIQILRSLLESIVVAPVEGGFEVEIVGEIAQMIKIGLGKGKKNGPVLNERMARSVKVVAGLEATYTEQGFIMGRMPETGRNLRPGAALMC